MNATIGVNLLWLVPGVVGGSEEYTLRLLRSIDKLGADDLWLRIYGRPELFEAHPDLTRRFEYEVAPTRGGKPVRVAAENTWLARATRNDDLVHHAGGVVPIVRSCPAVLTVHDLQPLEMPRHFSLVKRRWLAMMLPRSVATARIVIAPSRFSARRIHELLDVAESRLRVVSQGHEADALAATEADEVDGDSLDGLRRRFGRYMLFPSISYPHKRHLDLVAALGQLADSHPDLQVVFTGRPGPCDQRIRDEAAAAGLAERVHLLGRIPADELDQLYRASAAVVIPSEYEGFGNPALEAMARGRPVVVADAGALPEVCGEAGMVVPVRRPGALAAAVARLLDDPVLARSLAAAGLERARAYSWSEAARRLADAYRSALHPV